MADAKAASVDVELLNWNLAQLIEAKKGVPNGKGVCEVGRGGGETVRAYMLWEGGTRSTAET